MRWSTTICTTLNIGCAAGALCGFNLHLCCVVFGSKFVSITHDDYAAETLPLMPKSLRRIRPVHGRSRSTAKRPPVWQEVFSTKMKMMTCPNPGWESCLVISGDSHSLTCFGGLESQMQFGWTHKKESSTLHVCSRCAHGLMAFACLCPLQDVNIWLQQDCDSCDFFAF